MPYTPGPRPYRPSRNRQAKPTTARIDLIVQSIEPGADPGTIYINFNVPCVISGVPLITLDGQIAIEATGRAGGSQNRIVVRYPNGPGLNSIINILPNDPAIRSGTGGYMQTYVGHMAPVIPPPAAIGQVVISVSVVAPTQCSVITDKATWDELNVQDIAIGFYNDVLNNPTTIVQQPDDSYLLTNAAWALDNTCVWVVPSDLAVDPAHLEPSQLGWVA